MRSRTTASLLLIALLQGAAGRAADLQVEIVPRFNGAPLVFDALTNKTAASQVISVTRLDFLVSNFALRREDGVWIGRTNWFAYVNAREGRTSFRLEGIPTGRYEAARFLVGVTPGVNKSDPAQYAPEHPLNPNVNGLHWGWQGGYVFMAIEGDWQEERRPPARRVSNGSNASQRAEPEAGAPVGYSFHIANDPQLMTMELPLTLELDSDYSLRLALDVARIFDARHRITIAEDASATHSRTNDPLAAQLHENIERAFLVESVQRVGQASRLSLNSETNETGATPVLRVVAPNATPYRLTISALFPRPALPLDNPLTEEGVALGRALFNDPRLSINNSQSCASCHDLARAGVDNRGALSAGAEGKSGTRNAMPLFNLAWKNSFFWDGRAATLREQVLQPIENPIEMHETLTNVVAKLQFTRSSRRESALTSESEISRSRLTSAATGGEDYPALFVRAFGSPEISADRIARALEQFLLTQVSHDSKFDRVLAGQDTFTGDEQRGFELFHTEYDPRHEQFGADCFHCHGGPLLQNVAFANNGLDLTPKDLGRYEVTRRDGDKGKFAVPSLRNVAVTGPYMHDGRCKTLNEVVAHYSSGVKRSATLDPNLAKHPDGGVRLNDDDKRALVAFLKTLTDGRFEPSIKAIAQTP